MKKPKRPLSCSFCRKTEDEVDVLLAFTQGFSICNECVWLMVEIIATDRPEWRDRILEKLKGIEPDNLKQSSS